MKAQMAVFHLMMRDENTNVNGFVYLMDATGLDLKHQLYWSLEDVRRQMHITQVDIIVFEACYVTLWLKKILS